MACGKLSNGIKCIVVGDGGVGKVSLLKSYGIDVFPDKYVPVFRDHFCMNVEVEDKAIDMLVCYAPCRENYDQLRPLMYRYTDVFLICFSLVHPDSYSSISRRWVPELKEHCPTASIILVGTKLDLRNNKEIIAKLQERKQKPVTMKMGLKMAKKIKAVKYIECCTFSKEEIKAIFDEVITAFFAKSVPSRKCEIL